MKQVTDVATTFFDGVWQLFLKTDFPALDVSIAAVAVSFLLIRFSIRVFGFLTGFGVSGSDYGRAADSADKVKNAYQWKNRNKIGF